MSEQSTEYGNGVPTPYWQAKFAKWNRQRQRREAAQLVLGWFFGTLSVAGAVFTVCFLIIPALLNAAGRCAP